MVPEFPAALMVRDHPEYGSRPVAVVEGPEGVDPVVSCNRLAATGGIRIGMTAAEARMRVDNLAVCVQDVEAEAAVSSRLINSLQNISPFVEEDLPGTYFVQVSGMLLLHKTEHRFARAARAAVGQHGLSAAVGIASNKYVALVAAAVAEDRHRDGNEQIVIVPDRREQQFLASLSVAYLPVSPETKEKLRLLGIREIGQAARFPPNELIVRFEADGIVLARLSHGRDDNVLRAEAPPEQLTATGSFLAPLETVQEIVFYTGELLPELFRQLQTRSQGCSCVEIELVCEGSDDRAETTCISLAVETPGLSVGPFLRQLRQKCARIRLSGGVTDLRVRVPQVAALLGEQIDLACVRSTVETPTARRLVLSSGQQAVYVPQARPASLPEQSFVLVPSEQRLPKTATAPSAGHRLRTPYAGRSLNGLRLVQPARPMNVTTDAGRLRQIRIDGRTRQVCVVRGPWLLSGRWWENSFERRYYEIDTADNHRYLLFCQGGEKPQWYLQGLFD
jgi:nucleotidyltransferase/DNA polymerase involved in DNA repair